jgi:hypothetical protein
MSKFLLAKVADLFNSFNVTQQKWQSIKCRVIPLEIPESDSHGEDLRIILVQPEHPIVLLLLPQFTQIWDYLPNTNLVPLHK